MGEVEARGGVFEMISMSVSMQRCKGEDALLVGRRGKNRIKVKSRRYNVQNAECGVESA